MAKLRVLDVSVARGNIGFEVAIFADDPKAPTFPPIKGFLNYTTEEAGADPKAALLADAKELLEKTAPARALLGKEFDIV